MRFRAVAAILSLSAFLLISTPTLADDNKGKDKDAATAASDTNANKPATSSDAIRFIECRAPPLRYPRLLRR